MKRPELVVNKAEENANLCARRVGENRRVHIDRHGAKRAVVRIYHVKAYSIAGDLSKKAGIGRGDWGTANGTSRDAAERAGKFQQTSTQPNPNTEPVRNTCSPRPGKR